MELEDTKGSDGYEEFWSVLGCLGLGQTDEKGQPRPIKLL